ncbi:inclusion body family protein [Streptomyces sp. URMC 129]|uniref:inclusion body family protein n=1 Tax=Streptomyces sp. URMC 129 TaxID=3423407 RepID=UPI003F1CD259
MAAPETGQIDPAAVSVITNVLIAFDAATIVEKYPNASKDPANPTGILPNDVRDYIYMTVKRDKIIGNPGGELNFQAKVGDVIRWRETTFSLNFDYSALLYRYMSNDKLITDPRPVVTEKDLPYPDPDAPLGSPKYLTQTIKSHYWSAEVKKKGVVTYDFFFQILDGNDLKGYFRWDPKITIS